jgi:hypothetical protein
VRPILTFASETSSMTKNDERRLRVFEINVSRRIYGSTCEGGQWRKRNNRELEGLYIELNIVNLIKCQYTGGGGGVPCCANG